MNFKMKTMPKLADLPFREQQRLKPRHYGHAFHFTVRLWKVLPTFQVRRSSGKETPVQHRLKGHPESNMGSSAVCEWSITRLPFKKLKKFIWEFLK